MRKTPLEQLPNYSEDPNLNPGTAELTTYLPGSERPFVITGPSEMLEEKFRVIVANQGKRDKYAEQTAAATKTVERVTAPVKTATHRLGSFARERVRLAEVKRFDRRHGTNIFGEIALQRHQEEVLAFKQRLGLTAVDTCQKHRKAITTANK